MQFGLECESIMNMLNPFNIFLLLFVSLLFFLAIWKTPKYFEVYMD